MRGHVAAGPGEQALVEVELLVQLGLERHPAVIVDGRVEAEEVEHSGVGLGDRRERAAAAAQDRLAPRLELGGERDLPAVVHRGVVAEEVEPVAVGDLTIPGVPASAR